MNQTVVGVFNSHDAAEQAAAELSSQGFERSAMHIHATEAARGESSTTGSTSASTSGADEGMGVMSSIRHFFADLFGDEQEHAGHYSEAVRRGGAVLTVDADESRLDAAREALERAGAVDIEREVSSWRAQGYEKHDAAAAPYSRDQAQAERGNVLPVVEESLEVGKRQVAGGAVRVVSRVVAQPVSESVELRREEATIERRPVDRPVTEADAAPFQERTVEVTEMAEKAVVNKSARVVEEVVVGKHVTTETQVVEDTVRHTEVEVQRDGGESLRAPGSGLAGAVGGSSGGSGTGASMPMGGQRRFADVDDEFRRDYETHFASAGGSYEDYQPAYRGGYEMRGDSRFAQREWDDAEPDLRQHWESQHPGSAWERVKSAVRRGWDRATD
jgi:uncharacterized protein (TIGR02271 family)